MATTKEDISVWFDEARREGATHLLVVCDDFDYEDYPKSVMPGEDVQAVLKSYKDGTHSMQRVVEVYSMRKNKAEQLAEKLAFHPD